MNINRITRKRIKIGETDLILKTDLLEHQLPKFIVTQRLRLRNYINIHPEFLTSFEPVLVREKCNELKYRKKSTTNEPPLIVKMMARAGMKGNVGPMAAVAGTISQLCMGFMIENGAEYRDYR